MSEIKEITLMDEDVPAGALLIRGRAIQVNGNLKQIMVRATPALGAGALLDVATGNGQSTLPGTLLVKDAAAASGLAPLTAVDISSVLNTTFEVESGGGKFVQVNITQGATPGRVVVTALVRVPQE